MFSVCFVCSFAKTNSLQDEDAPALVDPEEAPPKMAIAHHVALLCTVIYKLQGCGNPKSHGLTSGSDICRCSMRR